MNQTQATNHAGSMLAMQSTDLINDIYFIFTLMICYGLTLECSPQAHALKI